MHLSLISAGLLPLNLLLSPSRAALRPSDVPKSSTTALMRAFVPASVFAFARSVPLAKLSFSRPHSPLGSAAVIAIPAAITLSRRTFHSSEVKFDLSVMHVTPLLPLSYFPVFLALIVPTRVIPIGLERDSIASMRIGDFSPSRTRYISTARAFNLDEVMHKMEADRRRPTLTVLLSSTWKNVRRLQSLQNYA